MGHNHPNDIWPGGDSITDTCGAASVAIALPTLDAGDSGVLGATDTPKRVLVNTNAANGIFIKFGKSGVSVSAFGDASDGMFILKGNGPLVFVVAGNTHIAHFGTGGAETITITPLCD